MSAPRPAPLLQSWGWGEVQARAGWRVERLRLAAGMASVQLRGRGRMEWGYVPRGPVPADAASLGELVEWARGRSLLRLRVEPEAGVELAADLRRLGFRPSPFVQPQHTLILTLGSEEQLLAGFKRGARYNVRLAERKGVQVEVGRDADRMARLAAASATRQRISLPSADYYRLLFEHLPGARTYIASVDREAVGGTLAVHFDGRGYDLYSGASGEHRELKPMYLIKWEALRGALADGCGSYDLWGVSPGPDRSHPWYGLWEFKSGFGGELVEYVGCWELVFDELRNRLDDALERGRRRIRRVLNRVR